MAKRINKKTSIIEDTDEKLVDQIKSVSKKKVKKRKANGEVPTGSDLIDLVVGGKIPFGIVNIVGDSSSGKSFIAGEIIANAYHLYKGKIDWFYDDAEKGYRFNTKKLYKMKILHGGFFKQKTHRSHTLEDFERNLHYVIEHKEKDKPFIYVLDSFDSITSEAEIEYRKKKLKPKKGEKKETGSYNLAKQKENHAIFRTTVRQIEENNIILIVISQVKERIGVMFGAKYYRTGGKSLDFYPNVILWLAEVEKYGKKGRPVGISTKVLATKCRNDKPFRSCIVDLIFDYGIDNIAANINFLCDLKTEKGRDKEKLICSWDDEQYTREELIQYIEDNDLEEELTRRVVEKWEAIEESISSKGRKPKWKN